jgi:hypothetical protein
MFLCDSATGLPLRRPAAVAIALGCGLLASAVPTVNPPPNPPPWWNVECDTYAYAWWEDDIIPPQIAGVSPLADPNHWGSDDLFNTEFTVSVAPVGGVMTITIFLDNEPRPAPWYKELYIYARGVHGGPEGPMGGELTTAGGAFQGDDPYGYRLADGTWFFEVSGEVHPQPASVLLQFHVSGLASITDVWAGENCIPEPMTLVMATLGGVVLLRKRAPLSR